MHTCLIHSGQIDAAFVTRVDLFRWCLLMGVAIISLELMEIVFLASLVTVNTYADRSSFKIAAEITLTPAYLDRKIGPRLCACPLLSSALI